MKNLLYSAMMFALCFSINLHAETNEGKVIVVMSNAQELTLKKGKKAETGFFLNEFVPQGKKPVLLSE